MKEKTIVQSIVGLLVAAGILFTGNTDLIYPVVALLFFVVCIAYAEWCERL
jgi:hypothetical protein